jgi:hypothetical protein
MEYEQQEAQRSYEARFRSYVTEQKKLLLEKRPELADENNFKLAAKETRRFLQEEIGLTESDLNNPVFSDHRLVDLLFDAQVYRKMQKERKK